MIILGISRERSVHQIACHFLSLPIPGLSPVGHAERSARMKRSCYGERDYAFGQTMLTLRTAIGLTRAGIAEHLGVSRHAVGEWEAGSSYPKAEHLKALLALAVGQQAFPAGREEEEIRAFWKAAHQKMLLDESWLSTLLSQQSPSLVHMEPVQVEQTRGPDHVLAPAAVGPRVEWNNALDVPSFYGRQGELATLAQWIVQDRCRVVSVLGLGGIGKSALVARAMQGLAAHFDVVLFRSLRDAPECSVLLESCLQVLAPQPLVALPPGLEPRLSLLLEELRELRVLLVLDNLEALLQEGDVRGHLRPGYEGYSRLLQGVAQRALQSCLLLTSREKSAALRSRFLPTRQQQTTLMRSLGHPLQQPTVAFVAGTQMAAHVPFLQQGFQVVEHQQHPKLAQLLQQQAQAWLQTRGQRDERLGGEHLQAALQQDGAFGSITQGAKEHDVEVRRQ